jgi:type I site-specific restriction-modification system R (restriction) subunit
MIDEAHRTQYGFLKANLERALPNATNVAYTGTPTGQDLQAGHDRHGRQPEWAQSLTDRQFEIL